MKYKSTYIFGQYYSSKEIKQIMTNDIYKDSFIRAVLELRVASGKLKKVFRDEFEKSFVSKLIDKMLGVIQ